MIKRLHSENIICFSTAQKNLRTIFILRLRVPLMKVFLTAMLCLFSALFQPGYAESGNCAAAQEAVEAGEMDPEEYADMYPYCGSDNNIDMPLDDGVPFLFLAAALFGAIKIYKRQNELKENAGLNK
jgi:hypothetical protein